ncbi:MAG: AAA family ATPase [Solirubrobacterales bacterium]
MTPSGDIQVLILTGPPGVGKTTTAGVLAERSDPSVHLESDVFFRFIRSGYVEPWRSESHDQNRLAMRIVGEAAAAYAAGGYFTIVDGIVIPRLFLGPIRDVLHAAGLRVAYAVLRAPLPVCTARFDAREGGPLADPDAIEQIWSEFTDLGECEGNAIEAESKSPDETADAITQLLEDGQLTV